MSLVWGCARTDAAEGTRFRCGGCRTAARRGSSCTAQTPQRRQSRASRCAKTESTHHWLRSSPLCGGGSRSDAPPRDAATRELWRGQCQLRGCCLPLDTSPFVTFLCERASQLAWPASPTELAGQPEPAPIGQQAANQPDLLISTQQDITNAQQPQQTGYGGLLITR